MSREIYMEENTVKKIPLVNSKIVEYEQYTQQEFERFRKILVSPTVNTPEYFKGYGGFNCYTDVLRLINGDLYVTFIAGYAHGSAPTPLDICQEELDVESNSFPGRNSFWWALADSEEKWDCPTGGIPMWMRSKDNGATWSKPRPYMKEHIKDFYYMSGVYQFKDGGMIATGHFWKGFGYHKHLPVEAEGFARMVLDKKMSLTQFLYSDDNGESWHEWSRMTGPAVNMGEANGFFETNDGALMMFTSGAPIPFADGWPKEAPDQIGTHEVTYLMRSEDRGKSWSTVSVIGLPDLMDADEPSGACLPDGSIGVATRPTSAFFKSYDNGKTWSGPKRLQDGYGWGREGRWVSALADQNSYLYTKGDLIVTPDGVVVSIFGNLQSLGSGQVIYSRDSGETWFMPAPDRGFQVNPWAYYPSACILGDGTILVVGHNEWYKREGCPVENKYGPMTAVVNAVRFRIKSPEEGEGVELLPVGEV